MVYPANQRTDHQTFSQRFSPCSLSFRFYTTKINHKGFLLLSFANVLSIIIKTLTRVLSSSILSNICSFSTHPQKSDSSEIGLQSDDSHLGQKKLFATWSHFEKPFPLLLTHSQKSTSYPHKLELKSLQKAFFLFLSLSLPFVSLPWNNHQSLPCLHHI